MLHRQAASVGLEQPSSEYFASMLLTQVCCIMSISDDAQVGEGGRQTYTAGWQVGEGLSCDSANKGSDCNEGLHLDGGMRICVGERVVDLNERTRKGSDALDDKSVG